MIRFIFANGIIAAASLLVTSENASAADVTCTTTLYFCSYGPDDVVTVTTTETAGYAPLQGFGVYLNSSTAKLNDITIITSGNTSDAIRTNSENSMFRASRLTIKTSGVTADGINLSSNGNIDGDNLAYVKDFADIEVNSGIGVRANNFQNANANTVIILPDGTRVRQTGTGTATNAAEGNGYAVYAGNRNWDTNGLSRRDILLGKNNNTLGNAYVFIGANADIASSMTNGHAIYANKGGLVQLGDGAKVSTTGNNAYALYASREQQGNYKDNVRQGYIYLGGGATLRAENSPIVIRASGEGSIIANKVIETPVIADSHDRNDRVQGLDKTATRDTSGIFDVIGIMDAIDGGTIALNMSAGSQFLGSTNAHPEKAQTSKILLNIDGIGSQWKMDADSNLTHLTLSGGATLTPYDSSGNLTNRTLTGEVLNKGGNIDLAGAADLVGDVLTIKGKYTGADGFLILNTTLNDDSSATDKLIIDGDTTGNTFVRVKNIGGTGAQTVNGIQIIEVTGASDGTFKLKGDYIHKGDQAVVGGAYAYRLFHNGLGDDSADGNWYLRSELKDKKPHYQPGAPVYEIYPQFLLGLNTLPTLQQRVGNRYWSHAGNLMLSQGADAIEPYAPNSEAGSYIETSGIWGRVEGSYTKMQPRTSTSDATYDYSAYKMQAGIDGMLHEGETGKLIGGITVHYTHGVASVWSPYDSDLGRGRISSDGYGFGGTLTWYGDDGLYLDNQAQVTWHKSDLSYQGGDSILKEGNHAYVYAFSTELGKRFTLNDHWSVTPQAQLNYTVADFNSFTDVFGAYVSRERAANLRGRLGVSLDYQNSWQNGQGMMNRSYVYGIANLYHESLDGTKVDVSNVSFYNKSDRLWAGIGLGGSYNWNDDKYSLYGEGSVNSSLKNFGDSYAYKGTIGLRVKW